MKHLSNFHHTSECHTHTREDRIHQFAIAIFPIIINPDPSAACAHHTRPNISHASRTHLARLNLARISSHRAVGPLGPPSQRITPYRYPSSSSAPSLAATHPPRPARAPPPHRQTTSTVVRGFGCVFLCLPACLPACLRSHLWPTALRSRSGQRSRSGTHCVVQRPQPLQLRLQLRLVGALEVVERRLGRVRVRVRVRVACTLKCISRCIPRCFRAPYRAR